MKNRIQALLLVLAMLIGLCPATALAASKGTVSELHVNPLYRDIVSVRDIRAAANTPPKLFSDENKEEPAPEDYPTELASAAAVLRCGMKERQADITLLLACDSPDPFYEIAEAAMEETGVSTEGDYIRWGYMGWEAECEYFQLGGTYYDTITFHCSYYTTAQQEAELTRAADALLDTFGFSDGTSEYEKIRTVYDYVCAHVTYDYANLNDMSYLLKHTPYAALINGTAVCQGYALLVYRLLLDSGVSCRLIPGNGHAWNIARIDGSYYNLDSTWDAGASPEEYQWFLLCDSSFGKHPRYYDYTTADFYRQYPMSESDYSIPSVEPHEHAFTPEVIAPDCETAGYTVYKCACGYSYVSDVTEAKGHDLIRYEGKEASCTEGGWLPYEECTRCDHSTYCALPAKGHSYVPEVIAPGCETFGYTVFRCECGDSYVADETVPTGHRFTDVSGRLPTCEESGWTDGRICSVCGTVFTEQTELPALGHDFRDGKCTRCGETDPSFIAAPTVKLTNVASSGKIKVSWDKVDNAAKYEIWRATSKTGTYTKLATTTGTGFTNTSTTAGKTYYYKVRGVAADGTVGAYSSVHYLTCDLPQPVVKLTNVASSGKIKVSWGKVDGASKYEVYRATSKTGTYTKLGTTTGTSYTNTSTTAGKTYYYKVKAICKISTGGNSAFSSIHYLTCDLAQPTVKLTTSNGHPKVSWAKVSGATKYEVYRATSKTGTYSKVTTVAGTSYTDKNAKKGKTYYYKVKAVCATSAAASAYSAVKSIKAK